jgi:hypothetical protein
MTKVDKIGPEDWVTVDKIGRTEILGPAKNGCKSVLEESDPQIVQSDPQTVQKVFLHRAPAVFSFFFRPPFPLEYPGTLRGCATFLLTNSVPNLKLQKGK